MAIHSVFSYPLKDSGRNGDGDLDELLDLSALTNSATNVVELRTSDLTVSNNVDLSNVRRMYGEDLLNAYAVSNLSYGEGLGNSAALLSNYGSLEELNSLVVTVLDSAVYLNGITDLDEVGVTLHLLICKSLKHIHVGFLLNILRMFMQSFAADHPVFITEVL